MRLLFVGTNRGGGGTESHFITLALAMLKAGHAVAAVVYPGSPIHTGLVGHGVKLYDGTFRNAFDPRGIRAVFKASHDFHPDWIISSFSKEYWPLALISHILRVKLALFKHMDFPMRFTTRYFIPRLADRFIVISHYMRDCFIAYGIPATHIQVLHNPLDLNYFHPDQSLRLSTRLALGFKDEDIVLGFVGAMHRDKGIFILAEAVNQAMARLPNLKAFWIGEGPHSADFMAYLDNSNYAARHVVHKWAADVRPYYSAMDIFAIPSLRSETFGRVSIEAQACSVPVLGSNHGGIPETMEPNITGHLLPPGDVSAWRDAILALAGDKLTREQMKEQGRRWVSEQFSAPIIAQQFGLLLEGKDK